MQRRDMMKTVLGAGVGAMALRLAGVGAILELSSGFACSKNQLLGYANDVLSSFKDAQPYISQLLPNQVALFTKLIASAGDLVTAITNSDKTGALAILSDITPSFGQIATALGGSPTVLAILGIADIALHFIANNISGIVAKPGTRISSQLATVNSFKAQRVWGCDYHPGKCKGL